MTWQDAITLLEFLVVCGILFYEILTYKIEQRATRIGQANLDAFQAYFRARIEWYATRNRNKRKDCEPNSGSGGAFTGTAAGDVGVDGPPAGPSEGEASVEPDATAPASADGAAGRGPAAAEEEHVAG